MDKNKNFKDLDKLEFLVIVPREEDGMFLTGQIRQLGGSVKHLWPVPMPLPSEGEVLICEFSPEVADCTPWLPGEAPLPFILHIPRNNPVDFKEVRNCAPHGLLYSPSSDTSMATTVLLARDQFHYEQRLRSRIYRLDENLRSVRVVEEAKVILMDAKHIGEEEAYRVLRKTAMERRITVGSIATAIVDSHKLLI